MENKLSIIGNISVDKVKLFGATEYSSPALGGAAFNIAASYSFWGGRPAVYAHIGPNAREILRYNQIIDFSKCRLGPANSPEFAIEYDANLSLTGIDFDSTALVDARLPDVSKLPSTGSFVHFSLRKPYAASDLSSLVKAGFRISVDLISTSLKEQSQSIGDLLTSIELLFCNEEEFRSLQSYLSIDLLRRVVVTAGAGPVGVWNRGSLEATFPVAPTVVVDPTGAGDAFAGGYLRGYLMELEEPSRIALGMASARLAVGGAGVSGLIHRW